MRCPCGTLALTADDSADVPVRLPRTLPFLQVVEVVLGLISDSLDAWRTRQYGELLCCKSPLPAALLSPELAAVPVCSGMGTPWGVRVERACARQRPFWRPICLSPLLAASLPVADYYQRVLNGIL